MAAPRLPRWHDLQFSLTLRRGRRSLLIAAACGLGFGVFMAAADAGPLRGAVPAVQHAVLAQMTLAERLAWFARGALLDEVALRLVALAALVWIGTALRRSADRVVWWGSIALVALAVWPLFAWAYISALDPGALTVLREVVLHGGAGLLWGWLCWRHGWLAGLGGHISAHLALQPLLGLIG